MTKRRAIGIFVLACLAVAGAPQTAADAAAPSPTVYSVDWVAANAVSAPVVVEGSGFFESGTRLKASATGGIVVNSVASVTPSELLLNVTTTGVPEGTQTLTITNPDGQTASNTFSVGQAATCVTCRDIDGDADADMMWHDAKTGQIWAWLMFGSSFSLSTPFGRKSSAPLDWRPAGVADFNTDGKPDVLWHNRKTGQVSAWLMDRKLAATKTPVFAFAVNFFDKSAASLDWTPVTTSDFNNDGKADILWHNTKTGQISAWLMDRLTFVRAIAFGGKSAATLDWRPKASADFNDDSKADIVWHNTRTGQISAWLLNGTQFESGTSFVGRSSASLGWRPVFSASFKPNGRPDIVWHDAAARRLAWWNMDGLRFVFAETFYGTPPISVDWAPVA